MLILTLNNARPRGGGEAVLLGTVLGALYPDATALEVRRELEYLKDRCLVEIDATPAGPWLARLTHHGVDLAEYTIDCGPGIARPPKYW
ncbi:MAG: hypothetical protein L0H70_05095 [Xanthomonadales bacterium]|nr:hypothetical protein [Xanthomonadales bacterium]